MKEESKKYSDAQWKLSGNHPLRKFKSTILGLIDDQLTQSARHELSLDPNNDQGKLLEKVKRQALHQLRTSVLSQDVNYFLESHDEDEKTL